MRILIALCAVWIWIPNEILLTAAADSKFSSRSNQSQQNTPESDANLVSPDDLPDDPDPVTTPPVEQIDHDTVQCIYYQNYRAECQVECSDDPIVWEIDPSKNMKMMKRECHSKKTWKFDWDEKDGVLDASVFPHAKYRHQHEVCAVCTFSRSKNKYFDCSGIAVCHPERTGLDQCSGGLPWRGLVLSGDPLKAYRDCRNAIKQYLPGKSPKGNITSYAQNSVSGGGEQTDHEDAEPEATTRKSSRRTTRRTRTTTSDNGSDEPDTTQRPLIIVYVLDPLQRFFSQFARIPNIFTRLFGSRIFDD